MGVRSRPLTDREIAGCFNRHLGRRHGVRLVGGAAEPLYLPGQEGWSVIRYTRDYAASALHELAHWCIAGAERRRRVDYGYWYAAPPRTPADQMAFVAAELPVQALESVLASACGVEFRVSVDDPHVPVEHADVFARDVAEYAATRTHRTMSARAMRLVAVLKAFRKAL
jgi:elongation factor P hydroxylase